MAGFFASSRRLVTLHATTFLRIFFAYCAFLPPVSGAAKPKPRTAKPSAKHEFITAKCISSIMKWAHADTMIPTGRRRV